jgi:dethiobiotin synthetase
MKKYFITGTDTGIGKTLVSAIMTSALQATYWKPIQSGSSDQAVVRELTGLSDAHFHPTQYAFRASLSPDQAASLENITIDLSTCKLPQISKPLIVEGAGGVFVPLNEQECMLDLMKQFAIPVVIVSRGQLGTINHTLLSIEALRRRDIPIHGVVFSGDLNPDNQTAIEKWGKVKTLFHLPNLSHVTPAIFQDWVGKNQHHIQESLL